MELRPPSDVGLTNREIVSVLLGVMVGIRPFAGFVSLAYSTNDGFRRVEGVKLLFPQSSSRKVPRP